MQLALHVKRFFFFFACSVSLCATPIETEIPENVYPRSSLEFEEADPSLVSMERPNELSQKPPFEARRNSCKPIEKKQTPFKCTVKSRKSKLPSQTEAIFPTGRPCPIESPGGIRSNVAFIIWQSKMWGFEFAGKSFDPTNAGTASVSLKEKAFVPDFAWRPGFKIDLGYDCGFDGWNVDSRWTFYKGEDTSLKKSFTSQISPPGIGVVPLWFYPFYNVQSPNQIRFSEGTMSWRHYFNSIDLEIGRASSLSDRLSMRLYGGLKGAWSANFTESITKTALRSQPRCPERPERFRSLFSIAFPHSKMKPGARVPRPDSIRSGKSFGASV